MTRTGFIRFEMLLDILGRPQPRSRSLRVGGKGQMGLTEEVVPGRSGKGAEPRVVGTVGTGEEAGSQGH